MSPEALFLRHAQWRLIYAISPFFWTARLNWCRGSGHPQPKPRLARLPQIMKRSGEDRTPGGAENPIGAGKEPGRTFCLVGRRYVSGSARGPSARDVGAAGPAVAEVSQACWLLGSRDGVRRNQQGPKGEAGLQIPWNDLIAPKRFPQPVAWPAAARNWIGDTAGRWRKWILGGERCWNAAAAWD